MTKITTKQNNRKNKKKEYNFFVFHSICPKEYDFISFQFPLLSLIPILSLSLCVGEWMRVYVCVADVSSFIALYT